MYHIMSDLFFEDPQISDNTENECPICLDIITPESGYIILECCNQKMHIQCLVNWYISNPSKKNCFICNQSNKFCKDLDHFEITQNNFNHHIIPINNISQNNNIQNNHNNDNNENNNIIIHNNPIPYRNRINIYSQNLCILTKISIFCIIGTIGVLVCIIILAVYL